jgi:hypothetical protein
MNTVLLLGGSSFVGAELSETMKLLGWSATCHSRNPSIGHQRHFLVLRNSLLDR